MQPDSAPAEPPPPPTRPLDVELGGDLRCARCGYNLRGLSIRGTCPECATPVRATILTKVDPYADELRPLRTPRLTALALLVWGIAPGLAAALFWSLRVAGPTWGPDGWLSPPVLGVVFIALSGLAALALVRPHAGIRPRDVVVTLCGVALYIPLVWALWRLHAGPFAGHLGVYGSDATPLPARLWTRVVANVCIGAILLLLRPNARTLAARSMLMRAGRVDRQTMLALAAVAGVLLLGDLLRLAGIGSSLGPREMLDQAGQVLTLIGSLLLTIGLVGVAYDCVRLYPVLTEAPLSFGQIIAARPAAPRGAQKDPPR
ncbi:MAG: hypothetical protein SFY69_10785 [Planctomycetota bacterium]|nr:hypothetical protein [Planctomycetota bacterium]